MFFLVLDVSDDILELRVRVGERPKSFLPHEFSGYPPFLVYESCGTRLDVSDQIRDSDVGGDADKDMDVIGHRVDLDDLLFPVGDDAGDISVEFGFVLFWDEGLSRFDGKDDMYVELGIGICHRDGCF